MGSSDLKYKFLIETENVEIIIDNIKKKVDESNYVEVMRNKIITRAIYQMPFLEKEEHRWLRILIGDVDCHRKTGVTITYKMKNTKDGQEKKIPKLRVEEFDQAKSFFESMGFVKSSTQENKRTKAYVIFENIKYMIKFDVWPQLEDLTFLTIDAVTPTDPRSKKAFIDILRLERYDISKDKIVDVDDTYEKRWKFRASDIPELRFGFDLEEQYRERLEQLDKDNDKNLLYLWLNNEGEEAQKLYTEFKNSKKTVEEVLEFLKKDN